MTFSPSSAANSNFGSSDASPSNSDFLDLFELARKEKLECSQLQRTFKRLRRSVALGAVLVMFQGSSTALSSAWADGCVDNPTYCVVSTADALIVNEGEHTLRSAVATANGSGSATSTIGFADQLFGITRDSNGVVTNTVDNPIISRTIILDSTLEIKTNLAIKGPTNESGSNILTIQRGTEIASGEPLIGVNDKLSPTDSDPRGMETNKATTEIKIENVTIDSQSNPSFPQGGNQGLSTPGVAIQVKETIESTVEGERVVVPTVVLANATITNTLAESSGAAISTPGDVRVENSNLSQNIAANTLSGNSSDGGAIKAEGTVTVVSSALNNNNATGNGGAISASSVSVSNAENSSNSQLIGNTAGGNGGAINSSGNTVINGATLAENTAGGVKSDSNPDAQPTATLTGGDGGAVNAGGTVQISESQLTTNRAMNGTEPNSSKGNGGAINAVGDVSIANSSANANTAGGNGGVISSAGAVSVNSTDEQARPALEDVGSEGSRSDISGNFAAGNGGAIAAVGTVEITNSNLIANQAGAAFDGQNVVATTSGGDGGAVYSAGNVSVNNTVIGFNGATGGSGSGRADGQGGGISAGGEVVVQGSVISENSSEGNGGAISAATIIIAPTESRSEISNNYAEGNGGAVSAVQTVQVVTTVNSNPELRTKISENSSSASGGAISAGGEVSIYEATLSGNIASADGGAIKSESTVLINSSILSSNIAGGIRLSSDAATPSAEGGNGGAIASAGDVTVTASELSSNYANSGDVANVGGSGGAIYAEEKVTVVVSKFIENGASLQGGAIYGGEEVTTSGSIYAPNTFSTTFEGNSAYVGGAIFAGAAINLSDTEFFSNSAFESGGAIYAVGDVAVTDSVFGINIESDVAEQIEPETHSNFTYFGPGGAIYSEGNVTTNRSAFVQNIAGSAGGAIAAEKIVSVSGSIFAGNGTFGDGGAVYALGGVIVENSSLFFANTAGVNPESEFGFGFLYPIFLDGPGCFMGECSGGNGGAIFSEGAVRVSGSTIGVSPPLFGGQTLSANRALCAQSFWEDGAESGWSQECEREEYYYDSENDSHNYELISVGNGGGIYAVGKVTIEGGNTTINIDLDALSLLDIFIVKEESFEKSYLTNNFAQNNGGAVYALGGARVENAVIGSTPEINPNYNPWRGYLNLEYIPARVEPNPLFGNGQPPRIPNDLYDPEVSPTIPNPSCEGAFQFGGNLNTGESWCVVDEINHPISIENPDQRWIFDYPNELYSDQEFLYIEAVGEEFVYELDDPTKESDSNKFDYAGNHSVVDGGALYVEGSIWIANSSFSGNTSGEDGGAIYSEGALEIKDSTFSRNWADDDGGAIKTTPGDGDLLIARTAFIENLSMDDGGAIDISTGEQPHYDDLILSSLFRDNEAFGPGGAIDSSFAILILNTFENNDSPDGHALHLHGGILSGNKLIGTTSSSFQSSLSLCSHSIYTEFNFMTDESCFAEEELVVSNVANVLLSHAQITDPAATLTLPSNYAGTLLENFKILPEFYLEAPSVSNPAGIVSEFGSFITDELNKDFNSAIRDSAVLWNPGHLQTIFPEEVDPTDPITPGVVTPEPEVTEPSNGNTGGSSDVVVVTPEPEKVVTPILITVPVLTAEELARIAAQRAEQLATELKRQQEAEKAAAERLAKIKADKLARDKARALAAEKRRAQLAALKAKIAATQARGEALKRKPSWINLMKNSPKSNAAKKLVKAPNK